MIFGNIGIKKWFLGILVLKHDFENFGIKTWFLGILVLKHDFENLWVNIGKYAWRCKIWVKGLKRM